MEKEISSGAMLGIVLIALAAIIGLGFGVFAIAKGTANQGVTNVQTNLGAVSNSAYTDYDQTVVTGTQVTSALQTFNGKSVAVLVATQAAIDQCGATLGVTNWQANGAGVASAYTATNIPAVQCQNAAGALLPATTSGNATVALSFVNYNALLGGATPAVKFDTACYRASSGFNSTGGKLNLNSIAMNIGKSGMMEYIPAQGEFQAYLVKDLSGTILGVSFQQINGLM